jgi:hypothetical protein
MLSGKGVACNADSTVGGISELSVMTSGTRAQRVRLDRDLNNAITTLPSVLKRSDHKIGTVSVRKSIITPV